MPECGTRRLGTHMKPTKNPPPEPPLLPFIITSAYCISIMASVNHTQDDRDQESSPNTGNDQNSGTSSSAKQQAARPRPCPSPANPPEELHPDIAKWLYGEPPAGPEWLWEDVNKRWCLHLTYCARHGADNCELWAFQKSDGSQSYMHLPTLFHREANDFVFYTQAEMRVQSAKDETAVCAQGKDRAAAVASAREVLAAVMQFLRG